MQRFARLYDALDATTSTNRKVAAMQAYFAEAPPADAAWAVFFLTGARLKRLIAPRLLAIWGMEATGTPDWMFGECWSAAGDQAEIVALLLDAQRRGPPPGSSGLSLSELIEGRLLPLREADEQRKKQEVLALWRSSSSTSSSPASCAWASRGRSRCARWRSTPGSTRVSSSTG